MIRTKLPELLLLPNILSLSRILLTPAVGYFLWKDDSFSTIICVLLLIVAGITDGLDGYFARRYNLVSKLGLILDPLADKIFAAVLLIELVLFRDLPVWLAGMIVGRDVVILLASLVVLGKRKISVPSNLTGQYTFFAIVILIGFSIIRFEFGVRFISVFVIGLLMFSLINYAQAFRAVLRGISPPKFKDRPLFKALRVSITALVLAICLVAFITLEL